MAIAVPMMDPGKEGVESFIRHPPRLSLLRDRLRPLLPWQGAASPQRGLGDAMDWMRIVTLTRHQRVRLAAAQGLTARRGNLMVG